MVTHQEQLPECVKEHDMMWKFFFGTAGFFVMFLGITTPIVIANVNELKKEDATIRAEAVLYQKENSEERTRLTAERNKMFLEIKIQLAQIQTSLLEHRKSGE